MHTATVDVSRMLAAFLEGDERARRDLPSLLDKDMRRLAFAMSPADFNARQLIDDVVARAWELLLRRPPGSYRADRGTPLAYAALIVRTAVRDVRQQNRYEIRPSRDYSWATDAAPAPTSSTAPVAVPEADARDLLERALADSPEILAAARLIAFDDATFSAAAKAVGLSRFALKRRFAAWAEGASILAA